MPDSRVPVLPLGVHRKLCLARTVILARPLGVASPSALAPKFEDDAWGRRPAFIFSCASSNVSAGYVLYCNPACLELDAELAAAQPILARCVDVICHMIYVGVGVSWSSVSSRLGLWTSR